MESIISHSVEETNAFAEQLVKRLRAARKAVVIGLLGNLGAGKTTFVQAIARSLGIDNAVQSPTFVLQKIYKINSSDNANFERLVHFDAYRLEGGGELGVLGWSELARDPKNIIIVEWADRVKDALPNGTIFILLEHVSETERRITVK